MIRKISLRNDLKRASNTKDFYYPVLAYECSVSKLSEEGDALQEAVLKLINIGGYAPQSAGNDLGGIPENIMLAVFKSLEDKKLIEKVPNQGWKLTMDLKQALEKLFMLTPSKGEEIGYMFYNPIGKNIFPYFHKGNLTNFSSEFLAQILYNDIKQTFSNPNLEENDLGWEEEYTRFYRITKEVKRIIKQKENKITITEEDDFESYEEDNDDNVSNFNLEDVSENSYIYADEETLVKPLKGKKPLAFFLKMQIVFDDKEPSGFKVKSPFPLEDQDAFNKNIDYLLYNKDISQQIFFEDNNKKKLLLKDFIENEINKHFPDFKRQRQTVEDKMLEEWPLIYQLKDDSNFEAEYKNSLYGFKQILRYKQNTNELGASEARNYYSLVDNVLEAFINKVIKPLADREKKYNSIKRKWLWNEKIEQDIENIKSFRIEEEMHEQLMKNYFPSSSVFSFGNNEEGNKDIADILKHNFKKSINELHEKSNGNSILHKLINLMWLNYRGYTTDNINKLLSKNGFIDFFKLVNGLNYKRSKYSHHNPNNTSEENRNNVNYLIDNFYKVASRIIESIKGEN